MDLALILFGLGAIGFIFNRNNLILMIISIEIRKQEKNINLLPLNIKQLRECFFYIIFL